MLPNLCIKELGIPVQPPPGLMKIEVPPQGAPDSFTPQIELVAGCWIYTAISLVNCTVQLKPAQDVFIELVPHGRQHQRVNVEEIDRFVPVLEGYP